jgi:hypothetical protein
VAAPNETRARYRDLDRAHNLTPRISGGTEDRTFTRMAGISSAPEEGW